MDLPIKLSQQEKIGVSKISKYTKSLTEFLSSLAEKAKDASVGEAIEKVAPWLNKEFLATVGTAAGETIPYLKFVVKVCEEISKETDPELLGHLACTMAYQKALEAAIKKVGGPHDPAQTVSDLREKFAALEPCEEVDMGTFDLKNPLPHEFVRRADLHFEVAAYSLGYVEAEIIKLKDVINAEFPRTLDKLLTNGKSKEKFAPFTEYTQLPSAEARRAKKALSEHAQYQRWQYEQEPVLRKSPFALQHVYIDTECGILTWQQIGKKTDRHNPQFESEQEKIDPFVEAEKNGGRHNLLTTVMQYILDPAFREAIVIQGTAGAGKSSFTIRLCVELLEKCLHPIRVRLKDLRLDQDIVVAVADAIRLTDEARSPDGGMDKPKNILLDGDIFKERANLADGKIAKYVLILDGWDEISLSVESSFQQRVNKMLEQLKEKFIGKNDGSPLVRLVITGRPAAEINSNDSRFLRDHTPILTMLPLTPTELEKYFQQISQAVTQKPLTITEGDNWAAPPPESFAGLLAQYTNDFAASRENSHERTSDRTDVLGSPLLAFMVIRLISEPGVNPEDLLSDHASLHRQLINLTCAKGAKAHDASDTNDEIGEQARIVGNNLRSLLHQTAAAMTILGQDQISHEELRLRLRHVDLDETVSSLTKERVLSDLLISFYFKGGYSHLGCEFAHKSFREYLFAEAIVEALKNYGLDECDVTPQAKGWQDFAPTDPRYTLSRKLAELLAPQWVRPEVYNYLWALLTWEIKRIDDDKTEAGIVTPQLNEAQWNRVRDGLADLWQWWTEGAHLRAKIEKDKYGQVQGDFSAPYVNELIRHSLPIERKKITAETVPETPHAMDAHLGEALCQLCAVVHAQLAGRKNYDARLAARAEKHLQSYQLIVTQESDNDITLFLPSGTTDVFNDVFQRSIARINSAEGRPESLFPNGARLDGARLDGARLDRSCLLTCINLLSKKQYDSLRVFDEGNEMSKEAKEALYRELTQGK